MLQKFALLSCVLMCMVFLAPSSHADEWNKKTIMTFNEPVEIPGMVLPAGTYVFKLADSQSDRDIVQIFNKDESKIFDTILAIPDYRLNSTARTVVTFAERPKDSPEAVNTWFYPGDNYGFEFVYPKARAFEIAKANNRPVLAHRLAPTAKPEELKTAPIKAVSPTGSEVQITEAATPPPPQTAAVKMPHTASNGPLLLMLGLGLLGLAFALPTILRLLTRRLIATSEPRARV